jgi:hypothetical protein
MTKTEDTIIRDVRIAIDEIGVNGGDFIGGSDDDELDTIIRRKIAEAVDWAHSNASIEVLSGDSFESVTISSDGASVNQMLRFISARADGWTRSVRELTEEGTEEYAIAIDEYVGASKDRPVAVLVYSQSGKKIELLPSGETDGTAIVIKRCVADPDGVKIDSGVYEAVISYLAAIVLMTLNDSRGENLMQLAKGVIGMDAQLNNAQ